MTTITEAKDKVAQNYGFSVWEFGENAMLTHISNEVLISDRFEQAAEIYAEAKAKEAYSQGVKDWEAANEKANKILDGLREKSKYVEAYNQGVRDAAENAKLTYDRYDDMAVYVDKQSILKLLK